MNSIARLAQQSAKEMRKVKAFGSLLGGTPDKKKPVEKLSFDKDREQSNGAKIVTISDRSSLASILNEDREHDWLAKQMREEERILRRGDMLDLGASHSRACDSEMLKLYHLGNCDADEIDNGEID